MTNQNIIDSINIIHAIGLATEILGRAKSQANRLSTDPAIYPLSADVEIDLESALDVLQDADQASSIMFKTFMESKGEIE